MKLINNYSEQHHQGIQPVRVLQHNLTNCLDIAYRAIPEEEKKLISGSLPQKGIKYVISTNPIFFENKDNAPHLTPEGVIVIHETFLSYVWCVSCFLTVFYLETIHKQSKKNPGGEVNFNDFDHNILARSTSVINYGFSLKNNYSEWDKKELLNPETYYDFDDEIVSKINATYVFAMGFILCHEFAHSVLGHKENKKNLEEEADQYAYKMMDKAFTEMQLLSKNVGCLCALSAILLLKPFVNSTTHPDSDKRLIDLLYSIDPDGMQDDLWAIAAFAMKAWDDFYKLELGWGSDREGTYKELVMKIYNEV